MEESKNWLAAALVSVKINCSNESKYAEILRAESQAICRVNTSGMSPLSFGGM